jgi:PAS domain S-box-containing protein
MPVAAPMRWGWIAAIAVAYVVAGKIGLLFAFVHASATAVWPPTGIAVAALLLLGPRVWPAIAVGAFVVNVTTAGSVATSAGVAAGNTLEALIAAALARRFAGGAHAFHHPRTVFVFASAMVPAAIVSATVGVASLTLAGYTWRTDLGSMWATWVLGDVSGALIIAPLVLLWASDRRIGPLIERPVEAGALLLALLLVGEVVFSGFLPEAFRQYPLAFLTIPLFLWAALRFERRAAALVVLALAGIALHGTLSGFGPFAGLPPTDSLLILQAFMATMAAMTLVVSSLAWSREREGALLRAIIDRIPVMITVYRPDTQVLRLNHEFERLTGWTEREARGVDLMERCYPDPAYREEVRGYMESLATGWRDIAMATRSGQVIATSWSNIRLPDDTRVGIGLDVRERTRAEAERERARAEAEAASQAKDEFIAMLGHELRNPLGAISAALSVIEACDPVDPRALQARAVVARQVRHLVRLVDDLLDVSRLVSRTVNLDLRPVELTELVRRAVGSLAATAPRPRLTCATGESVWIAADETRLDQIVMNLIGNALKFTPASGQVTVSAGVEGGRAVLRVVDTGAGIDADLLPRIFDLFVQGRTDLHRREAGLGIGLTLTRRLVELHGGSIEAASEGPGRGSTFTVTFPAVEAPAAAREPAPAADRAGGRRRVLIIEDNDDAREMLRYVLESLGHEVHEAADGPTGLDRALALHPDAVIVDIGLPGLDGYSVARRLRKAGRRDTLLAAVTGYGQPGDRQRSSEAGFDAHLTKPVDPAVLSALLGGSRPVSALRRAAGEAPGAAPPSSP